MKFFLLFTYLFITIILILFVLLLLLVPLFIESNSLPNVHHQQLNLDDFHCSPIVQQIGVFIYGIGDLVCHQISSRSFFINGNQMPICSRCTGISMGMSLIAAFAVFRVPQGNFLASLLQLFSFKKIDEYMGRRIYLFSAVFLLISPMLVDVTLQYLLPYVSWNNLRLVTGFLFGIAQGGIMIAVISNVIHYIIYQDDSGI